MRFAEYESALAHTQEVYEAYCADHGHKPSVRDMAQELDLSVQATWARLTRLRERGLVKTRGERDYDKGHLKPEIRKFAYDLQRISERKSPIQRNRFLTVLNNLLDEFERNY